MDTDPSADSAPVRSKIWMPYGNVILQAESTQFRANRDVLAQQSSVFMDMFSVPQVLNEPTVEGCPIVHVSDTAKDWELLFGVLYNPPFDVVASMFRLGKKYEISMAKENAVRRIRYEFPIELDAWSGVEGRLTKIGPCRLIELLNFVYKCEVTSSIAFCCLRDYKLESLLTEFQRDDGTCPRPTLHVPENFKLRMAIALERISYSQHTAFKWLGDTSVIPHKSCKMRATCTKQRRYVYLALTCNGAEMAPCYGLDNWDDDWEDGLCCFCGDAGRGACIRSRNKIWEGLPNFFGFPDWKDLEDTD
ncbi:hypothetical protein FB451DRAFT_1376584 [Mycena latifolia]|nr:hypothetical protein FB451DRAFT_1376584 [Mycena latifolia]